MDKPKKDSARDYQYLTIALQYYIAARSSAFIQSIPVAANLYHHAIEMFLKYFLLDYYSANELKQKPYKHDLHQLWLEFKKRKEINDEKRFDDLVTSLNTVEDLRYPSTKGYSFGLARKKGADSLIRANTPQYVVNIEEIDEFVSVLLKGRVAPGWVHAVLHSDEAREEYSKENPYASGL